MRFYVARILGVLKANPKHTVLDRRLFNFLTALFMGKINISQTIQHLENFATRHSSVRGGVKVDPSSGVFGIHQIHLVLRVDVFGF